MQFIYPEFLFALFALAIPVIIHLFNFRRFKKLYFTNVRFLKEIKQDTRSRSRLKHILVLISRLLALAFLVFAFAQPYFPSTVQSKAQAINRLSIYIDNSFSMDAQGRNGSLLEEAKQKAREIAMAYKASDQFQLLTNEFEARHQRLINKEEFLQELAEVKPGSSVRSLNEVIARQSDLLLNQMQGSKSQATSFIISDFQKSVSNIKDIHADSLLSIRFLPLNSTAVQNVSIDTAYLDVPFIQVNTPASVTVRLKNSGDNTIENIPLKLSLNGVQKALGSVNIPANASTEIKLPFTPSENGWQKAELSITDYPVTFDDSYFLSFNIRPYLQVLSINGNQDDKFLKSLYNSDPYFQYHATPAAQIDYSSFSSQQLIILNEVDKISSGLEQEISRYVKKGGVLFVIPPAEMDLNGYQSLLSALNCNAYVSINEHPDKITRIESASPVFADVFEKGKRLPENLDLPLVQKYYQLDKRSGIPEASLLKFDNNYSFLSLTRSGKGYVFTLAVPLEDEFSNFQRHALFVPVMIKAALQGGSAFEAPMIIGRDHEFQVPQDSVISNDQVVHLVDKDLNFDIIPDNKMVADNWVLSVHDEIKQAGNYSLLSSNRLITVQSFNYDRKESDLSCYTTNEIEELVSQNNNASIAILKAESGKLGKTLNQLAEGTRLWKYFILAALLFLALEILLIRYFNPGTNKTLLQ